MKKIKIILFEKTSSQMFETMCLPDAKPGRRTIESYFFDNGWELEKHEVLDKEKTKALIYFSKKVSHPAELLIDYSPLSF